MGLFFFSWLSGYPDMELQHFWVWLSKYSDWVYLDVSEICIKLLGNVGAEARCWRLLLFVADDLVPENILLRNLLMETKLLIVNQTSLWCCQFSSPSKAVSLPWGNRPAGILVVNVIQTQLYILMIFSINFCRICIPPWFCSFFVK